MKKALFLVFSLVVFGILFLLVTTQKANNNENKTLKEIQQKRLEMTTVSEDAYDDDVSDEDIESNPETQIDEENLLDQKIQETLASMTIEEKVCQLFFITPEALTGYETVTAAGNTTKDALKLYPVGGLIYFAKNIQDEEQTKELLTNTQQFAKENDMIPIFLAVDEEGGTVARVASNAAMHVTNVGNMCDIGATSDVTKAYDAGFTIGGYLSELGFNLDFAPVADTLTNPDNQIVAKRSFGSDPTLVSEMSRSYLDGLTDQGIIGSYKHFPGHGATLGDTHEGYAYTNKTYEQLQSSDFVPFMDGCFHQVPMMMVGHISLPNVTNEDVPASLSQEVITGILREDFGYQGVVITDSLSMGAITDKYNGSMACKMAFLAGSDMLLMPKDFKSAYTYMLEEVNNGNIDESLIDQSVYRILKLKYQSGLME